MISFYPGPSKLEENIAEYFKEAADSGLLAANHRSEVFMDFITYTKVAIRQKLNVPEDYEIAFVSSATECWEIIAQSFVKNGSLHLYNGAFGEKWHAYASKIKNTQHEYFNIEEPIPLEKITGKQDVVCITQNETSNATEIHPDLIRKLYSKMGDNQILAIDATSSLGGRNLPIAHGDIWFASVQKCLGLPPGLALLICSPKAVAKAEKLGENKHYNSFKNILKNLRQNQTHNTPNIGGIYMLKRVLEERPPIEEIDEKLNERMNDLLSFFEFSRKVKYLVKSQELKSKTLLALSSDPITVGIIKRQALLVNIILGNGYGIWKTQSFRIANFPAHNNNDFRKLKDFMGAHI